jgi:hypothetical protein
LFESTHPFVFFDYFRVPYEVPAPSGEAGPVGRLRPLPDRAPGRGALHWVRADGPSPGLYAPGLFRINGFTVAGHLYAGSPSHLLPAGDHAWYPAEPVLDGDGRWVSSVWRDRHGGVFLPFDPGEVMSCMWSEQYGGFGRAGATRQVRHAMVRGWYAARPLIPRQAQIGLRRTVAKHQSPPAFPAWPVEHGLHDLYGWLLGLVAEVAGTPVPWIAPWPDGKRWAMVLTHDVETQAGYDDMELLRSEERSRGYRSSWNFVAERYDVSDDRVAEVVRDGCEVGVHGLRHDGRDLASRRLVTERLPAMRRSADRWGAVGFRSPGTQRSWALMPMLGFDYDSSYTDTDPYEPQPGGCCTYLPFFIEELVELPITLPQDHTVFGILERQDGRLWLDKARDIRSRGGMVLALTHPDYARNEYAADAWRRLLKEFEGDQSMWQPLPRELAAWWRARAASLPRPDGPRWRVTGPAMDRGRIELTGR